jgi:protein-S-isoprenylcysteine O-methyltransferase Ste14
MKRLKTILRAGLIGAAIGVLVAKFVFHKEAHIADSLFDKSLIARWPWVCAVVGWVLFSLYWEISAKNAAAARSAESGTSRGVHVFLANAALILEIIPLRGVSRFVPVSSLIMAAGLAVEAMGLALAILARRHLGRNWSGEISIKVDHQLIRSVPYKLLRHPIYTGLLAMYAGTALVTGTWLGIGGFVVALFAYVRKIQLEEVNLQVAFGEEYEAYRRDSWALAPGLF